MDIREIEKLHAQYAQQPVIIDLTGRVAALPGLTVPESRDGQDRSAATRLILRYGKPVAILAAVAMIALGGGIGAGKLWQVVGRSGATPAASAEPVRMASGAALADRPINAAPAQPVGMSALVVSPDPHAGMSNIDPHELLRQTALPAQAERAPDTPVNVQASNDEARAIASPIHAPHRETVPAAQAVATATAPEVATPKSQPVTEPAPADHAQQQASAPVASPKPHHPHRAVAHPSAASTPKADPAPPQAAHDQPSPPAKSADVQLF